MVKLIQIVEPRELQAAKEFLELGKKLKEHVEFLQQRHEENLQKIGTEFNKKLREAFIKATYSHLNDPMAVWSANTHILLRSSLEPEGNIFLAKKEDWHKHLDEPPAAVDHSEVLEAPVLH